jgi:hypothetical protein
METAMIEQFINWWSNFIGIQEPATVQMVSGILAGAGATLVAYIAFAGAVGVCGLLISAFLRPMI